SDQPERLGRKALHLSNSEYPSIGLLKEKIRENCSPPYIQLCHAQGCLSTAFNRLVTFIL
ncbi:TPA: hypothetical protein ACHVF0_004112, partial [Shigella sonnei]